MPHDVWMLAFPPLLLWKVGFTGPAVLLGGYWSNLSGGWQAYLSVCLLGAAGLAFTAVRYQLRRPPTAQLSNHSHSVDVVERLGRRPLGSGPYQTLARLPGNEIFQIEVSHKTLQLPRLPAEWDGLNILHLSDLHFIGTLDLPFFEEVTRLSLEQQADLIVFTGDLLDKQRLVEWLPATLGQLAAPLGCYFILGNHDWYLEPEPIRQASSISAGATFRDGRQPSSIAATGWQLAAANGPGWASTRTLARLPRAPFGCC